jgi:DNA-binding NarL/FixJ family response regulator
MINVQGSCVTPSSTKVQFDREKAGVCVPRLRVLVVEDNEPFRRFVCATLKERQELQVICEVSDGLEAVRKAEELQPNLIVLDIGLPTLNGIEAARRIRKLAPESKILFLTQESSVDVVQEALGLGALGYVVKSHAGSELLAALQAVCQGKQFVGNGLSGHSFTDATDAQAPDSLSHKEALPSFVQAKGEMTRSHEVQFYSDDASLLVGFTCFIEAALEAGNAVVVIATDAHLKSLLQRLQAHGVDSAAAIEQGRYIPLNAAATLSTFMVNDLPDPARFFKVGGDLIAAAAKAAKGSYPGVSACGECAPILWAQGKPDAAIQLEHLWDQIANTHNVDILCGYVMESFEDEAERHIYRRICAEHSAVIGKRPAIEQL